MNAHFLQRLQADVPLIETNCFAALLHCATTGDRIDDKAAEHPFFSQMRARLAPTLELTNDGIGVLTIEGVIAHRPHPLEQVELGLEDSEALLNLVKDARNEPDVRGLFMRINSPGGMVMGGMDISYAVRELRKTKPVVAWTGGMAASLGYAIASQANQIVASRSALVGSIGSVASFVDISEALGKQGIRVEVFRNSEGKFKGVGIPGTSLSDSDREHLQKRVNTAFSVFRDLVLENRGSIPAGAMQGQSFYGSEAKEQKLIDHVGDMEFAMDLLRARLPNNRTNGGSARGKEQATLTELCRQEIAAQRGETKTAKEVVEVSSYTQMARALKEGKEPKLVSQKAAAKPTKTWTERCQEAIASKNAE